jgi:Primase C terminal 2 (PriCT-2)
MVIAPPSARPGIGPYIWSNWGTPIADAPQWLIDLVSASNEAKHKPNKKLIAEDQDELAAAVEAIRNDMDDYADWKELGMKIYAATDGDGFQLFYDFSKRWINGTNSDADIEKAWEQIESSPPSRAGAGSIFTWPTRPSRDGAASTRRGAWPKPTAFSGRKNEREEKSHFVR